MPEFEPSIPSSSETSSDTNSEGADRKGRRRSRKSREAANIGGLASESVIWARDPEPVSNRPKSSVESIVEALRIADKKESDERKPATADAPATVEAPVFDEQTGQLVYAEPGATQSAHRTHDSERSAAGSNDVEQHFSLSEMDTQDAELATLSPAEVHHALDEYVQMRSMEVIAEQVKASPDSPEAIALAADAAMLERMRSKLEANSEVPPAGIAEAAYQEVLQQLPPDETAPAVHDAVVDHEREPLPDAAEIQHPLVQGEDVTAPVAQAGFAGGQPPVPPRHPGGISGAPDMPPVPPPFPVPPVYMPEFASAVSVPAPTENIISVQEAAHYERRAETRGLLVGGLVGYFVGRRRGRIKTEKRLLPVQANLEKQVRDLHESVAAKEAHIRQEAARRSAQTREFAQYKRQQEQSVSSTTKVEARPMAAPVVPFEARPAVEVTSANTQPQFAPSLEQSASASTVFENVPGGQIIRAAAETAAVTAVMTAAALEHNRQTGSPLEVGKVDVDAKEVAANRIKQLPTSELLAASAAVVIGNERLRDIYESKRISEPGLRRIMVEYARGGNVEQVLKQEIHNKELTYERDPKLRKNLAARLSAASEKAAKQKGKIGQQAGKAVEAVKPKLAASAQKAKSASKVVTDQATKTAKKLDNPENPMQQVVVRTWVAVTAILAIIAFILLIR